METPPVGRTRANQPPALERYDVFASNRPLADALRREGAAWAEERCSLLGVELGGEPLEWGRLANEHPPRLRTHDRFGERIDEVEFHPAWHALLELAVEAGLHALPWREPRPGAHVARAALFVTFSQVEAGVGCPISMTHAAVPALRAQRDLLDEWEPRLLSLVYDPDLRPAAEKDGALIGMAMTERRGGSDVRTNETVAEPIGADEAELTGSKWFCSAPMSDAFLVLAQAPAGLSCYLVPRVLPDSERNGLRIERLKDKLGNRSNASAEITLERAWGRLVGEEGRGVATIAEMVNHTRLDCVLGSTALIRRAVAEATHHAAHRITFGRPLAEQPLMANVLADLCLESEAATAAALRLARAYDEDDLPFRRLATAVLKYWVCKTTPPLVAEALECVGGNGYVEESVLPRLHRESPLNSLWEGAGNVNCLDVLRVLARMPDAAEAYLEEVRLAGGADARLDGAIDELEDELARPSEGGARHLVELMAAVLQASLLVRTGEAAVSDAFTASRIGRAAGRAFGTLPAGLDLRAIVERGRPSV
ncbi:MAG: acyl-CoA dehydrogenase family protein [Thermoleophilia bacterium]|nr:acyl-CoA dehydrogenase family protein [Thermoleophilia bacterium]